MRDRHAAARLKAALADRPVVLLHGARQTGKTTLARSVASTSGAQYVTLDDLTVLAAARGDPSGFVAGFTQPLVIDEVQRAPDLLLAIKATVDRDRTPGRFLITGSANVLLVPRVSESLAGRMEIVPLWPFSQGEIEGAIEGFIDTVFSSRPPTLGSDTSSKRLTDRVLRGGYPEAEPLASAERRRAWYDAYVTTILQRDVLDLARIEGLTELPRLLAVLAARPMAQLNIADLSRGTGLPQSTLKRYFALLETVFLVRLIPPWYANIGKRLVKSPKVALTDTGLAAHLMGIDDARLASDRNLLGGLMEAFVAMELVKQSGWSADPPTLYHFRTHEGDEVDLVLERRDGTLVGIEVKSASTLSTSDFKGLRTLAAIAGPRFRRGVVLYGGHETVPFGTNLFAMPLDALWRWNARLSPSALTG
jgi:uncharacterized protein